MSEFLADEFADLDPDRQVIKIPLMDPIDFLDELGKYNWRVVDPAFACVATSFWVFAIVLYVLYRFPQTIRLIGAGRAWQGRGIWVNYPDLSQWAWWRLRRTSADPNASHQTQYQRIPSSPTEETPLNVPAAESKYLAPREGRKPNSSVSGRLRHSIKSYFLHIPSWSNLELGHIILVVIYLALVAVCTFHDWSNMISFPNRAGFTALCQLPLVILFGSKNSIITLLIGQGHGYYFNFLHRWSGRGMFIFGSLHSVLWVIKRIKTGRSERLYSNKADITGIIGFFVMCAIVALSLPKVRRGAYRLFFASHVIATIALFVLLFLHTKWKYTGKMLSWSVAFYLVDLVFRMSKLRIRKAKLEAIDDQMTLIHIPNCKGGWVGGQHVNIRFLQCPDLKESHPFTILNAPQSISAISPSDPSDQRGIILAARVMGRWTGALNHQALSPALNTLAAVSHGHPIRIANNAEAPSVGQREVEVVLEGPYSSLIFNCGEFEELVFVSGGSGATFAIGLLDDIVGRVVKHGRTGGERTRRIEFIWYIRTHDCLAWFLPLLTDIVNATLGTTISIHFQIYITRQAEDVKSDTISMSSSHSIPNASIEYSKPCVCALLSGYLNGPSASSIDDLEASRTTLDLAMPFSSHTPAANNTTSVDRRSFISEPVISHSPSASVSQSGVARGGGVGIAVCGPSSLCQDAQNCVARISPARAAALGGIEIHAESFAV